MFWRAIGVVGLWAMAASAQSLPRLIIKPGEPMVYAETERFWRAPAGKIDLREQPPAVCSIPLTEVLVAKGERVERMPILRPRQFVEPMPLAPLPAPPCKEDKR